MKVKIYFKLIVVSLILSCASEQYISWGGQEIDNFLYIETRVLKDELLISSTYNYSTFVKKIRKDIINRKLQKHHSFYTFKLEKDRITIYVHNKNGEIFYEQVYSYCDDVISESVKKQLAWEVRAKYYYEGSKLLEDKKFYAPLGILYYHIITTLEDKHDALEIIIKYKHIDYAKYEEQYMRDVNEFINKSRPGFGPFK